jgi:pilus assembly protein CpaE
VLEYLKQIYAYVVVDTVPILTDITLAAIDASDVIVLITTQDIPAIKNARLFLDLSATMGVERERVVFTMNRYDKRIAITPERISENLKQEVKAIIPLDERVVIPAVNRGIPFMLDNRTQPVARGILALAEAVRAQLSVLESQEAPAGKR